MMKPTLAKAVAVAVTKDHRTQQDVHHARDSGIKGNLK
jgi:hypothetical protein